MVLCSPFRTNITVGVVFSSFDKYMSGEKKKVFVCFVLNVFILLRAFGYNTNNESKLLRSRAIEIIYFCECARLWKFIKNNLNSANNQERSELYTQNILHQSCVPTKITNYSKQVAFFCRTHKKSMCTTTTTSIKYWPYWKIDRFEYENLLFRQQ